MTRTRLKTCWLRLLGVTLLFGACDTHSNEQDPPPPSASVDTTPSFLPVDTATALAAQDAAPPPSPEDLPAATSPGVHASPEALSQGYVAALTVQPDTSVDTFADALRALFPSDAIIQEVMDCDKNAQIIRGIRTNRFPKPLEGRAREAAEDMLATARRHRLTWRGVRPRLDSDAWAFSAYEAGQQKHGCSFKKSVETQRVRILYTVEEDGETRDSGEGATIARLGEHGWFIVQY